MDERFLQYSPHAFDRIVGHRVSEDEVEAIVFTPMNRIVSHQRVEHHGYSADGRELIVVTDRSETFVITIIDAERRRRNRRYKEMRRNRRRRPK